MGLIASKEFEEMIEEDVSASPQISTDVLAERFDPRSPTVGITRTPIHVMKATNILDDPRSPTADIERTPICLSKKKQSVFETPLKTECDNVPKCLVLEDPRSPTQGISRTPICSADSKVMSRITGAAVTDDKTDDIKDEDVECDDDPRSPSKVLARTPVGKMVKTHESTSSFEEISVGESEEKDDDILSEPIRMSSLEDQVNILSDPLETISIQDDLALTAQKENETSQKESESRKQVMKKKQKPLVLQHTNVDNSDDTSQSKLRSPLKVLGDRSPFNSRNVDYNSPRAIVQRKQTGKLAMKMKPTKISSKYKTLQEDKENM